MLSSAVQTLSGNEEAPAPLSARQRAVHPQSSWVTAWAKTLPPSKGRHIPRVINTGHKGTAPPPQRGTPWRISPSLEHPRGSAKDLVSFSMNSILPPPFSPMGVIPPALPKSLRNVPSTNLHLWVCIRELACNIQPIHVWDSAPAPFPLPSSVPGDTHICKAESPSPRSRERGAGDRESVLEQKPANQSLLRK